MLRALVLLVFYAVMVPVIGLVGIPWTLIVGNVGWMYRRAMWAAFTGVRLTGVKVEVIGRDRFDPQGTYIYMCNHVSNLDPPIVVPLIPKQCSVLVKKELFRIPILSTAMRMADFVAVDRQNRDAAISSVERAKVVMEKGINITIFPEGTRSLDGKLLPFKKGPFHLALETGMPVLPMTIHGSETLWPKKTFKINQGKVTLVFHPPIWPKDCASREELMDKVRAVIASSLPEHMRN